MLHFRAILFVFEAVLALRRSTPLWKVVRVESRETLEPTVVNLDKTGISSLCTYTIHKTGTND
jgi:hypothetical protein